MNTIRKTRGTHMLLVLLGAMGILFACEDASSSSDDSGSSTTDISTLTLQYNNTQITGVKDEQISPAGPTWDTDTEPTATYAVTDGLPAGLVIAEDTGIISGTPTAVQDPQDYTITATGTGSYAGTQTATVSITVIAAPIDLNTLTLSYDAIEGVENLAITETGPTWDTDTVPTATYAVTGDLPAGLVIDTDTGIISGTPTAVQAAQDYTITATGTELYAGTKTTTVSITIAAPIDLDTLTLSYDAIEGVENLAITETGPTWDTVPTATYAVTGDLPAGLVIAEGTGIISGTPTTIQDAQDYTITATGTELYAGTKTTTVSIAVLVNPEKVFVRWIESDSYKAITDTTTGTPIGTAEELKNIANDLAGEYHLTAHIDISEEEWAPLGSFDTPFTGTLHGNGHIIHGLTVDAASADSDSGNYQGLFASINNAVVEDVGIGVVYIRAEALAGAVAGSAEGTSKIENVAVAGMDDTAVLSTRSGGLQIGSNFCAFLGGLVGINTAEAEISDGYNLGVLAESEGGGDTSGSCTGGLAGLNSGTVHGYLYTESDATVVKGKSNVGGLVGENSGTSEVRGFASGAGIIEGTNYVGGLVGRHGNDSVVKGYVAGGTVEGEEHVGGLVGQGNDGKVSGYTTGVTVAGTTLVGGLAGSLQDGIVSGSVADGTVTATEPGTSSYVGGLVGQIKDGVVSGYVTSTVEGAYYVGGLVSRTYSQTNKYKVLGYVTNTVTGAASSHTTRVFGVLTLIAGYWDKTATGIATGGTTGGISDIANVVYDSATGTYTDSGGNNAAVFDNSDFLTQFDLPGASATWPELKPYRVLPFGALSVSETRDVFAVGPWSETDTVTWESSDATKVTVDATTGKITGVAATTAPVTITATWGGDATKTATVDITVQ